MLLALNKPYGVLCQFTDRAVGDQGGPPRRTLAAFVKIPDVYAAGRLDFDSEGLLLLTDDGRARAAPDRSAARDREDLPRAGRRRARRGAIATLRQSVLLNDGATLPAEAKLLPAQPAWLWPRDPPVRFRKSVPDAWIELTIREGRNRQVRRMTAAVGLPTLRLVRVRIGEIALDGLAPGETRIVK